jgi:hypothetical protein
VALADHALQQRNVALAAAMLALPTALYAFYVELTEVAE